MLYCWLGYVFKCKSSKYFGALNPEFAKTSAHGVFDIHLGVFNRIYITFNISIMSRKNKNQTNIWIAIGAIFLIILLIIWLTVADFTGDTDVAAFIAPAFSGLTFLKL